MPPKKASNKESKKTVEKKKDKVIEDKTFGLKNKKGAKTQKFIQQVQKQVKGNLPKVEPKGAKKEEKKKELEELNAIFRPVATQKVEHGVDPKSVLCAFFKQGQCTKGDKCKFSHDVTVEKRAQKKSVYVDMRDEEKDGGMENWDDETLRDAVEKKHGASNKTKPQTDIICKYFIDALENSKYGWFWECPGGGNKCHYRHALPPGFILKKDKKKADAKPEISMEELVEVERSKLSSDLPKLTLESFLQWKKRKIEERRANLAKEEARKRTEYKAGRHVGLSGRDMFTFNPDLADDNEMEAGEATFDFGQRDADDDGESLIREIKFDELALLAQEVTAGSGTQASSRTFMVENNNRSSSDEEEEEPTSSKTSPIKDNGELTKSLQPSDNNNETSRSNEEDDIEDVDLNADDIEALQGALDDLEV